MKVLFAVTLACAGLATARVARTSAKEVRAEDEHVRPFAPTPAAAPFLSLGYREATADLLFVRLRGYFGEFESPPEGIADLCEAIVELDPRFQRIYEYCGHAMAFARGNTPQTIFLRALALLERGAREFPNDWRILNLAGQIYTQDLKTDDPAQRRAWDEKGILLVESAIRKPGAPAELQGWAAIMRTKYGQLERAAEGLREMLLLTHDSKARKALIERLAQLEEQSAEEIASELYEARMRFEVAWRRERSTVPPTWYVLLGGRIPQAFDMTELATGGRDLLPQSTHEKLEELDDEAE